MALKTGLLIRVRRMSEEALLGKVASLRRGSGAMNVTRVAVVLFICIPLLFVIGHTGKHVTGVILASRPPPPSPASLLPRAVLGEGSTFTEYLDARWPTIAPPQGSTPLHSHSNHSQLPPHIWITLSGTSYIDTGLANLVQFVDQLNEERAAKYGQNTRQTVLIALCLEPLCVTMCEERGFFCWGGYEFTRPEKILQATWPKLAGMMEVLQKRDTFFVDADVFFRLDPYPHMLPLMEEYDLVIQEERNEFHFNTGWFWMRRGPASVEAWRAVLDMDMVEVSRDQRNMNKYMDTANRRYDPDTELIKDSFISPNNLKVKVLNPEIFFTFHFQAMLGNIRPDAVYIHATCVEEKFAMAKQQGFWGDIRGYYYSAPRKILTFDHHSGTVEDNSQLAKIVLAASYYTHRSFQPAPTTTFTKILTALDSEDKKTIRETSFSRRPYYSFPYERLGEALGVDVVEAEFASHAARHLLGKSVLDHRHHRMGWEPTQEAIMRAAKLLHTFELDVRQADNFAQLVQLLRSPSYASATVIKLVNFEWPDDYGRWENWKHWTVPGPLDAVVPCKHLDIEYRCSSTCQWDGMPEGQAVWPSKDSILGTVEKKGRRKRSLRIDHW